MADGVTDNGADTGSDPESGSAAAAADTTTSAPDATGAASSAEWFARIEEIGETLGHYQPIGARHAAFFVDDGPTLLVVFDAAATIRAAGADQMPAGYGLARAEGWSYLCLIADGETWFRDPAVWAYFDRQLDDGFFEDFEQVLFYGVEMGGYAAAAYSVAAPGSVVLTVRPQATLEPDCAEWDGRFPQARRLDFVSRYGYAPEMVEAAAKVFVIYDPDRTHDAMHATLFRQPHVTRLRCRHMGGRLEVGLMKLGLVEQILRLAAEDRLDAPTFYRLYREARRSHMPYLLRLISKLTAQQRNGLAARVAGWALSRQEHPKLREAWRSAAAQRG